MARLGSHNRSAGLNQGVLPVWQNRVIIDVDAFAHNVREIKMHVGKDVELIAVVKDDCYGHGADVLSRVALDEGADVLAVVNIDEAIALRTSGITAPVLILGITGPSQLDEIPRRGLMTILCQIEIARRLDEAARKVGTVVSVFIKIDTGMGRLGLRIEEVNGFISAVRGLEGLFIEGLITHLPNADEADTSFASEQLAVFKHIIGEVRKTGLELPRNHIANSAAIMNMPEGQLQMVRAGIILYGPHPSPHIPRALDLQPVMSFKTPIIYLKRMKLGETVSYKREYAVLSDGSLIATTPVGYRHGYLRSLSNKADGLYRGRRVPMAGVVCMDMTMFDLGTGVEAEIGDEITLLGLDGNEEITIAELAEKANTISYEIMTGLGMRSRRYYIREGDIFGEEQVPGHRLIGE
jgi:alanine racemase